MTPTPTIRSTGRVVVACAKGIAIGGAIGLAGVVLPMELGKALANANDVAATCEAGLSFSMARGEAGTVVSVTLDGAPLRTATGPAGTVALPATIAQQGDALVFTSANPDRSVPHSWTVLIDSRSNNDQSITRTVPACQPPAAATTTTSTTTSTTVPPAPSTTVPSSTGSTVVTTTPRTPAPTTSAGPTTPAPVEQLPQTGGSPSGLAITLATLALLTGAGLVFTTRRPS